MSFCSVLAAKPQGDDLLAKPQGGDLFIKGEMYPAFVDHLWPSSPLLICIKLANEPKEQGAISWPSSENRP